MEKEITYKRLMLSQEKTDEAIEEMKEFVGDRFYVLDDARSYLRGLAGHYAFGAYDGEKLVALAFGRLLAHDELSYYRRFVGDFLLDDLLNDFFDKRGGALNVFVIKPDLMESEKLLNIIDELTLRVIETLSQSVELIFVDLPVEENALFSGRKSILLNNGFHKFGLIEDFWADYTLEREEAICDKCGSICHCPALILYKRL